MALMQAVRFHRTGPPEVLTCEAVPKPAPAPGEVLIRIEATGVNFADTIRRNGDPYPMPSPLPYTLGGECIGIVEAVGDGGDDALIGQRVFGFPGSGCYAEYAAVARERVFAAPPGLAPPVAISLFVQGLTAALILKDAARLQPGEAVFVQGAAGGVGLLALQLARCWGAGIVIGAASTEDKRRFALEHGADVVVDYGRPGWTQQVMEATHGRGVDIVLEMTGGQIARDSLTLLAPWGRSIVYGTASGERLVVEAESLPVGNHTLRGFYLRPYLARRQLIEDTLAEFARLIADGRLRPCVSRTFALRDAAEAHRLLGGRQTVGKVVLLPG